MLELEETEMSLIINNKSLSGVVEIKDDLVGELTDRVAVSREDRVVLKAALRQLQREMRDETPALCRKRDDLSREGEGNRVEIVGLRFCL